MTRARSGLVALLPALLCFAGCGSGDDACTEIGCDSKATVTYSGFSVGGAYDLSIDLGGEKVAVHCNDPGSMEELDNPEDVTCDPSGFEILGERANHGSILVTIVDFETGDAIVVNRNVQLVVSPEGPITPNGPDCPPVCYERFGSVLP